MNKIPILEIFKLYNIINILDKPRIVYNCPRFGIDFTLMSLIKHDWTEYEQN